MLVSGGVSVWHGWCLGCLWVYGMVGSGLGLMGLGLWHALLSAVVW